MDEIYQQMIIELYKNPLNFGKLEKPTFYTEIHNSTCGDRLELFVKINNGEVSDAKFVGIGCAISQASASLFCGYLKGKKEKELLKITKENVLDLLKINLEKNPSRMRCALLIFEALKKALR